MVSVRDVPAVKEDYPYKDTHAARLLRDALERASRERKVSLRSLAKQLGYKQATVLSHMSTGRIPIPLERAPDIARAVQLSPAKFAVAAVAQRAPETAELLESIPIQRDHGQATTGFIAELTELAGAPFEELSGEQKRVIREVVLDQHPSRRWLSPAELSVFLLLRRLRPDLPGTGLSEVEMRKIEEALQAPR